MTKIVMEFEKTLGKQLESRIKMVQKWYKKWKHGSHGQKQQKTSEK